MNLITFSVRKKDVYERIFAISAYTVRAREAMGVPSENAERMLVTADDKQFLTPFIDNSISEIFTEIIHYHSNCSVGFCKDEKDEDEDYYIFNLRTPANYAVSNQNKLEQRVRSFVANRTLQSWYSYINPNEASIIALNAQNDLATLQALLTHRSKPSNSL